MNGAIQLTHGERSEANALLIQSPVYVCPLSCFGAKTSAPNAQIVLIAHGHDARVLRLGKQKCFKGEQG